MTRWPKIALTTTVALLVAGLASAYAPRPTCLQTPVRLVSVQTTAAVLNAGPDSTPVSIPAIDVEPIADNTTIPDLSEYPTVILVRPVGNDPSNCGNDPVNNSDPRGLAPVEGGGNPITMGPGHDFYPRGGWGNGQLDFEQRTMSGFQVVDAYTKPAQYAAVVSAASVGVGAALVYGGPPAWAAVSDISLEAFVAVSTSRAVGYGLKALAGYHLYNIATDPEYAGATMSIDAGTGVSSIYFAGQDLYLAGRAGARVFAARLPQLNPANYQMRTIPGFGMNLGNVSLNYQPKGPTVRLLHGTTHRRALSMLSRGPDPKYVEPGGGPPAGGISMAEAAGPYARGFDPLDYARGKARLFPDEGGAAILEIEVPSELAADSYALAEFRFQEGDQALDKLRKLWPSLPKRVIPVR